MIASGEAKRICLWSFWVANLLVDAVYVLLCWANADNLARASGSLHLENGWKDASQTARAFVSNNIWRAPIAACALAGLMVVLFNLMSCVVLVRRSMLRSAAGFGYGFVLAWAFVLSFFNLMTGLILDGFKDTVKAELEKQDAWSELASGTFMACIGFAYLVAVLFMLFFLVLLIFQSAVTKEIGIYSEMKAQKRLAEMNAVAAAGGAGDALAAGPI